MSIHMLLDLRHNNKVDIDADILNYLVDRVLMADQQQPAVVVDSSHLPRQVAELLGRVTSVVTNNARIWEVYAKYNDGRGKEEAAVDCRLKACRSLLGSSRWERDEDKVKLVVGSIKGLVESCTREGGALSGDINLHAIEMFLRSPLRLVAEAWEGSEYHQELLEAHQKIASLTEVVRQKFVG